ncbi:MAG: sugar ABC transporter permease [Chloroflexota bacterium]
MSKAVPAQQPAVTLQTPKRRVTTTLQRRQARLAWMMLLPTLAVVAFVALWPLIQTVYQSFTDARFNSTTPTQFVGLKNYTNLLQDTIFRQAIWVTIKFTVITVIFEFILGLIIAMVVNSNFKGRGLTRAIMLVPWAMITVVSAQMWKFMFNQTSGVLNDMLGRVHILSNPQAWLAQPNTVLPAMAAVDIWKTTPFVALLLLAGLQVIPGDVYEAADVDGASKVQQFLRITLPLLRPAILVTLIFRTLDALRVFDLPFVLSSVGPQTQTMAVYNYENLIPFGDFGYGTAVSVAVFLILAVFVTAYVTFLKVEQT